MSAILFGSISTIADTSELQRSAFNQAFTQQGLDWHWAQEEYVSFLKASGGQARIAAYAASRGQRIDAAAIHQAKSQIFRQALEASPVQPREGVGEVIDAAKQKGLSLALVTTTSPQNVSHLLNALKPAIDPNDFGVIVDATLVEQPKPAKDAYTYVLEQLQESAGACVAIEDNLDGLAAAQAAGIACIAFPNQNTANHPFNGAALRTDRLNFADVARFL